MNLVRELIIRACADVNAVKMTAPTGEAAPHTSTCHFICSSSLIPFLTLMCVHVGVAAFNISGLTLHQALKLPVQDGHGAADRGTAYHELEGERLEDLRASWRNVKYLIIDEIAMVGQVNFDFVHRRLTEIFGVRLPYGGISVLAVGDFFQLPPVKSGWIFFSRLWKEHFRMKELIENQRQVGDTSWAARLNVIRTIKKGDSIDDTIEVLKTRCSTSIGGPLHEGHEWRDALRLVATVQQQNEYNDMRLNDFTDVIHLVPSHAYINPRGVVARDDAIPDTIRRQIPQDIDNCGGLAETVTYAPRSSRSTAVNLVFHKVFCMQAREL
jgi:PIF1-like helicase